MPLSAFEDHFGENTCLKSLGEGGGAVEGGGEVQHVPDCERPFEGRGFWFRGARGRPFQRQRTDRLRGLAGTFSCFGLFRWWRGAGALWRLVHDFVREGGGRVVGGGVPVPKAVGPSALN